ncbi:putative bifunctional diguanylate cyclase/phosphodiesterase [Azospira restricta]|uniref:EAL domain-containing protein n=1 Tax=Azospira restricta TaxID=404405 RepID=A0A974SRU2_9RHOO|nr:EAL domain-containing protein [Azospira restricta]QRJ65292.1 EAL domain-containing protein [Azospira restricta]
MTTHGLDLARRTPPRRIALTRHFALVSLACLTVAALLMTWVFGKHNAGVLQTAAETQNAVSTQLLGNVVWPRHRDFMMTAGELPAEALRADPRTAAIQREIAAFAAGTTIAKVKIYDLAGRVIFSSDARQIGADHSANAGFRSARQGDTISELTHRDSFDAFEGVIEDRDLLSTYVPVRNPRFGIEGVVEIYSDVTALIHQMEDTQRLVIMNVALPTLAIYLLLFFSVRKADRLITQQKAALEDANRTLESRVEERTQQLSEANAQLTHHIEELERAQEKLRLSSKVFESSGEGITVTDAERRILAVNRAFQEITGYSEAEVLGRTPAVLKSGRHDDEFYGQMWRTIEQSGNWRGEIWNRRKDGEEYPEWLSISAIRNGQGELTHYVGVFADISEVRASQRQLEYLAHHDPLTGLPNRTLLTARLAQTLQRCADAPLQGALLFIDLDNFKHVNDTLGHAVGDQLLVMVARLLDGTVRATDTVARLGGDEFVVILEPSSTAPDAAGVARKIVNTLSRSYMVEEHELLISASIGIALFPADGRDGDTLLRNADAAMYQAKAQGRKGYHFYQPELTEQARERLMLEALLRDAVLQKELFLEYQPQFDIASGELVGVEALVRWTRPAHGAVAPTRFIPLAEECGAIVEVGEWVLKEACATMARLIAAGEAPPKMAINISVRQLEHPGFAAAVGDTIRASGVPAHCIELEITESVIMKASAAIERLQELRAIGVQISIDDFGTGYSSLSYLRRLPVDKLKIDRSFIDDLDGGQDNGAIVRAIIGLARSLNLATVAEGVEHDFQLEFLRRERCDVVQGYLTGRPMRDGELGQLVRRLGVAANDERGGVPLTATGA